MADRSLPSLELYISQINETPLLTAQEERELARRIANGEYPAREHLIKANLRLVFSIARGYVNKGLSLEDLIQEGNIGLTRAVEGCDGTLETRFSTYASFWIKQSIRRAVINQGKPIRLPTYMANLLNRVRKANAQLTERLGRQPSLQEIGQELGLSERKLNIVSEALRVSESICHSEPSDHDGFGTEIAVDSERPDDSLIRSDDMQWVERELGLLEEREAAVIRMRFGFEPYAPMTLAQVGQQLSLTRERVRQLENQAIVKLMARMDRGDDD